MLDCCWVFFNMREKLAECTCTYKQKNIRICSCYGEKYAGYELEDFFGSTLPKFSPYLAFWATKYNGLCVSYILDRQVRSWSTFEISLVQNKRDHVKSRKHISHIA